MKSTVQTAQQDRTYDRLGILTRQSISSGCIACGHASKNDVDDDDEDDE